MSDDWQVGDLGKCVVGGPWFHGLEMRTDGPELGGVYRVAEIEVDEVGDLVLCFEGWPEDNWLAACFRKIQPPRHAGERADWELILKSVKRRVDA